LFAARVRSAVVVDQIIIGRMAERRNRIVSASSLVVRWHFVGSLAFSFKILNR
jgi:ribosomal protein S25